VLVVSKITSKVFQSHCNRISYSCDWQHRPEDRCRLISMHISFPLLYFPYGFISLNRSRHCMYRTAVTIRTAQRSLYVPPVYTFNNSKFSPHTVFMLFVWIWERTAIISLYNINWLVFITESECVYCAVRMKYLDTIHVNFSLWK
jgi:hypothetical protein